MKKSTTTIAIIALLSQLNQPLAMALTRTPADTDAQIHQTILRAVQDVQANGLSAEEASQRFAKNMTEFTSSELIHYVYKNGSDSDRELFKSSVAGGLNASSQFTDKDTLLEALTNMNRGHLTNTGSHFKMSCGVGLGIGIPLILAGLTVSVIGLLNARDTSNQIRNQYAAQAQTASDEYTSKKKSLQEIYEKTYKDESGIKVHQDDIKAQIAQGHTVDPVTGRTYADILHDYDLQVSVIYSTRNSTWTEIQTIKTSYDSQIATISTSESRAIDDAATKTANGKTLALAGGISTLAGIPFLIAGLDGCHGNRVPVNPLPSKGDRRNNGNN